MSVDTLAHRASRYRWVILGIATFTQAASGFFVQGIGALGVRLRHDLDIGNAQLGLLLSAAQLVPLIGLPVAGELLDRFDERRVVGAGACLVAAALCAGAAAPGYVSLLLVLLVVGAGYSTAQPGGSKAVAAWFDTSRRGVAMGVRQAGLPLGGALSAAVLPVVAVAFGWRATLLTGGLVALLGGAVFLIWYRPPPTTTAPVTSVTSPAPVTSTTSVASQLSGRLAMMREPSMVRIMLAGTSLISVQCGVLVLTVLYLHDTTSLGAGPAALVLVAAQGAGVVGRVCLAAWSDRAASSRQRTVMTCMAAVLVGMAALMTPLGQSPWAACLLFGWLGFFGYGWYGPWVTHVAESAPPGRTGFAIGLAMSVNQIAIVVMPPTLGLLRDVTHSFAPAWGLLCVLTATALTVMTLMERASRPGRVR
ncbi:MFS transporter [Streptomyces sp. NPDC087300]|uniref:MFS transporter n=1 Tax=Streptomyces sp. NPDC087300 TaxID=3365780 RepID=UPI0038095E85